MESTSKYSVVNIGLSNNLGIKDTLSREFYRNEGLIVSDHLKSVRARERLPTSNDTIPSKTSTLSATTIGFDQADRHKDLRRHFREESTVISGFLSNVHPSRNVSFINRQYPETADRLSNITKERNENGHSYSSANKETKKTNSDEGVRRQAYVQNVTGKIKEEYAINSRKMRYNQSVGTQATVYQELTGRTQMPKDFLYPQKASHQQILALTGSLKMPDPFVAPPTVPRPRKWRGDDLGWET